METQIFSATGIIFALRCQEADVCELLTADARVGVGRDVRVHGELRMENAAMRVSVHGQRVQQLTIMLDSMIICTPCLWNQLWSFL